MKDQWFGDIHDFRKYGLLRFLSSTKQFPRITVAWMLTPPLADDPCGKYRNFVNQPGQWFQCDPERWADAALDGERFFRFTNDDDEWDEEYSMPDFPCRQLFFNHKPAESAEDVCEKFESEYGNCPFELAFIDIEGMTARDRKQFETPQQEADHIIGMFQKLAGKYQIPVILIRCYHDLQAKFPGEKLEPDGYSRSFVETAENILMLKCLL